jgi:hypothetical protein
MTWGARARTISSTECITRFGDPALESLGVRRRVAGSARDGAAPVLEKLEARFTDFVLLFDDLLVSRISASQVDAVRFVVGGVRCVRLIDLGDDLDEESRILCELSMQGPGEAVVLKEGQVEELDRGEDFAGGARCFESVEESCDLIVGV